MGEKAPLTALSVKFSDREQTLFTTNFSGLIGDIVAVGDDITPEIGKVQWIAKTPKVPEILLETLLRQATEEENARFHSSQLRSEDALPIVRRCVANEGLEMKVSKVIFSLSEELATIYYTAPKRIDFRHLVVILAKELRAKINMKQIHPRDEARLLGGIGTYGPYSWWQEEA